MSGGNGRPPENAISSGYFQRHFENLPMPSYLWLRSGDDFAFAAHNAAALRLPQTRVTELVGVRALDFFEAQPAIARAIHRCAQVDEGFSQEINLRFLSGVVRRVVMTYVPLDRDVVVVHAEDVTARRAVERALGRTERRFTALFEAYPDLVFRMDVDGNYLDLHVPDELTLPLPAGEIRGRNVGDLFGPEAREQHCHYARQAVETGSLQTLEYEVLVEEKPVNVESRISPIGDNEVVVIVRDITARSEFEQSVIATREDDRKRVGRELQRELHRLERGVTALRGAMSSRGTRLGEGAERALLELEAVGRDLQALARNHDPIAEDMSIEVALSELSIRMQRQLGISCRVSCAVNLPAMRKERHDLYRIAEEAIVNAVEQGGARQVELICSTSGGQFVLSIADDGKPFRLSSVGASTLACRIMRHRARRLQGTLARSLRSKGGTTVTCTCPIAIVASDDRRIAV